MRYFPLIAYGAVVAWFSLTPIEQYPFSIWDKLAHFIVYAVFATVAAYTAEGQKGLAWLTSGIILYGALLELLQSLVPGRSMSVLDIVANSLGAGGALLIITLFKEGKDTAD